MTNTNTDMMNGTRVEIFYGNEYAASGTVVYTNGDHYGIRLDGETRVDEYPTELVYEEPTN